MYNVIFWTVQSFLKMIKWQVIHMFTHLSILNQTTFNDFLANGVRDIL